MTIFTFDEAQHAIYIDFECRATKPPSPALLGVLVGSDDEDLQQIITDERLASARVASRRSRVASAHDSAGALVARAIGESRRIVGWSFFDRERLIEARPDLEAAIKDRYVNALQIARPWRKALHPKVRIEREDQYAAKHTLDKYARLAGYPDASALANAAPAKWIKHTLEQIAKRGSYRNVTKQTKRDWHDLLDYNRHDCLALRHILLKAARELECWRGYERTRFCVEDGRRTFSFMAGSKSGKLDALLERHGARSWAFITAWNPASVELGRDENAARQREFRLEIEARGYEWLPGEGIGADAAWQPEESLMVLGMGRKEAKALGRSFGQLAVVVGHRGFPARLVPCAATPILGSLRRDVMLSPY